MSGRGAPKGYNADKCGGISHTEYRRQQAIGISQPHARNCGVGTAAMKTEMKVARSDDSLTALKKQMEGLTKSKAATQTNWNIADQNLSKIQKKVQSTKLLIDQSKNRTTLNNACYNGRGAGQFAPAHSIMNSTDEPIKVMGMKKVAQKGMVDEVDELLRFVGEEIKPYAMYVAQSKTFSKKLEEYDKKMNHTEQQIRSMEDQIRAEERRQSDRMTQEHKMKRQKHDQDHEEMTGGGGMMLQQTDSFSRSSTQETTSSSEADLTHTPIPLSDAGETQQLGDEEATSSDDEPPCV